jgi:hypothetical protein
MSEATDSELGGAAAGAAATASDGSTVTDGTSGERR